MQLPNLTHRFVPVAVVALLAVALMASVSMPVVAASIPVLQTNGPVALEQARLMRDALVLMAVVVLPVFVLTALFVWRYRRSHHATYAPDWSSSKRLELLIWGVPTLIVAAIGYLVWTRTHLLDPYRALGGEEVLEVQAIATDWKWVFLYPQYDVATVNELAVPAGVPFRVELTSDTVMNAFFVPGLGGQIFAMAGMRTEMNLRADAPATMWGRNTQYSGSGFPEQQFEVRVLDGDGFRDWVAAARRAPGRLSAAAYTALAHERSPSPTARFAGFEPGLFEHVIARYGAEHVH